MRNKITILLLGVMICGFLYSVPPHPLKKCNNYYKQPGTTTIFSKNKNSRSENVPDSVLAIMVEFQDVKFATEEAKPDFNIHDKAFFERYLFHLNDYYHDASQGKYEFNYTVFDKITVSENLEFYGDDDNWENIFIFIQEVFESDFGDIDLNNYDSYLIFHAGSGQEADLHDTHPNSISTTFLNKFDFKEALDPENDNYQGILSSDNKYIQEVSICPEYEWFDDFTDTDPILGVLGVLAHTWGHQVGLPTLFDNVYSNGRSSGIGSFGIMGTGAWNALGFVPPLPCAWSRYYMGWDDATIIDSDVIDVEIFQVKDDSAPLDKKLYKINISEKEYFLLENRQQNPDKSTFTNKDGVELATFTFEESDEQEYYPEEHPYAGQPRFNFMKNRYRGCEWDFYLPGFAYGDQLDNDGSGLLIWHVDENILDEYFSPDFSINIPNNNANHKAVDLEEADGVQNLDVIYGRGTKNEAFKAGNNDYFGSSINPTTKVPSVPSAESYYGGTSFEVYNISESNNLMRFSVGFDWSLETQYVMKNNPPIASIDFDNDGIDEIFHPMKDGRLYFWENEELQNEFIDFLTYPGQLNMLYAYDKEANKLIFPISNSMNNAVVDILSYPNIEFKKAFIGFEWAASPVVLPQSIPNDSAKIKAILPLNNKDSNTAKLVFIDEEYSSLTEFIIDGKLKSNLIVNNSSIDFIEHKNETFFFTNFNLETQEINRKEISFLIETDVISSLIKVSGEQGEFETRYFITTKDARIFAFNLEGSLIKEFPLQLPLEAVSLPTVANVYPNGKPDILIGGENFYCIVGFDGSILNNFSSVVDNPDSTGFASGVMAVNLDSDDDLEIIGSLSQNRFFVWNDYQSKYGISQNFPAVLRNQSRTLPLITFDNEYNLVAYIGTDNGEIFRRKFKDSNLHTLDNLIWKCEMGNLQRTANYKEVSLDNKFLSNRIFIKEENFIYPNPLKDLYGEKLNINILINKDAPVKIKIFDIAANIIYKEVKNYAFIQDIKIANIIDI